MMRNNMLHNPWKFIGVTDNMFRREQQALVQSLPCERGADGYYIHICCQGSLHTSRRIFEDQAVPIFTHRRINHDHTIGSGLGTFTLRYPISCTRLAPYAWAGVGAIFGGGERDTLHTQGPPDAFAVNAQTQHFGSETKVLGQFGAGLEFRFARNFGWTNDLSFGVIGGPRNNFGMIRSGLNFAF